jgi:hypothetical protein
VTRPIRNYSRQKWLARNSVWVVGKITSQSDKADALIDILEISGGIVFAIVGAGLSEAGFHIWGFIAYFIAVACGIFVISHHLKKSGFRYFRTLFWSLMVLDSALFAFLS